MSWQAMKSQGWKAMKPETARDYCLKFGNVDWLSANTHPATGRHEIMIRFAPETWSVYVVDAEGIKGMGHASNMEEARERAHAGLQTRLNVVA